MKVTFEIDTKEHSWDKIQQVLSILHPKRVADEPEPDVSEPNEPNEPNEPDVSEPDEPDEPDATGEVKLSTLQEMAAELLAASKRVALKSILHQVGVTSLSTAPTSTYEELYRLLKAAVS